MTDLIFRARPEHLQLGEGVLLAGVRLEDLTAAPNPCMAAAALLARDDLVLGATQSGCQLNCRAEFLHTEERGLRTPVDGCAIPARWMITLTGALVEIIPGNVIRLLNQPAALPIAPTAHVCQSMPVLCWIGSVGGGVLAFELHNVLSTGGLSFRSGHDGCGSMPFTFLAQQAGYTSDALPLRMFWLTGGDTDAA